MRSLALGTAGALALVLAVAAKALAEGAPIAHETSGAVSGQRTFRLPRAATHVAVHWLRRQRDVAAGLPPDAEADRPPHRGAQRRP